MPTATVTSVEAKPVRNCRNALWGEDEAKGEGECQSGAEWSRVGLDDGGGLDGEGGLLLQLLLDLHRL